MKETTAAQPTDPTPDQARADILHRLAGHEVRFLALQFTDILGALKTIDVPARQFERALAGEFTFNGASVPGFVRLEEADLVLRPDPATFQLHPGDAHEGPSARVLCDIRRADGSAFEGDPRGCLRRVLDRYARLGLEPRAGAEIEFFLFERADGGARPADASGFLGSAPAGLSTRVRREIVETLDALGIETEGAHHEVGPGQQEIDLAAAPALTIADRLVTLKHVVRAVAARNGLTASFMPRPSNAVRGSALHLHYSLWRGAESASADAESADGLSDTMRAFIAGLLAHARAMCAVTNPLVNSYKRLAVGQAPVGVAWSFNNRSLVVRVPAQRDERTRCEVRTPDPAANPYLALAVHLAAGLDGIERELEPRPPVGTNVHTLTERERGRLGIAALPGNLGEALAELERDGVVRAALGEFVYAHFTESRRAEFAEYLAAVHAWEVERYLDY